MTFTNQRCNQLIRFERSAPAKAVESFQRVARSRSALLIITIIVLSTNSLWCEMALAQAFEPLDPQVDKSVAIPCGEKYAGTPPALKISDPEKYIQPWSGYRPVVPGNSGNPDLPVLTANIKHADYKDIELEGNKWSVLACDLALQSVKSGNSPFGSVILQIDDETGEVIRYWQGVNRANEWKDPTAHAEMLVLRAACRDLGVGSLNVIEREQSKLPQVGKTSHCEVYTSHESCSMCYNACRQAKLPKLYFSCTVYDGSVPGLFYRADYAEMAIPLRERAKFGMHTYQCSSPNSLDALNLFKLTQATKDKP
jgi:tRNA(Arg) A34 adenosine deaminase TadA